MLHAIMKPAKISASHVTRRRYKLDNNGCPLYLQHNMAYYVYNDSYASSLKTGTAFPIVDVNYIDLLCHISIHCLHHQFDIDN